MLAVLTAFSIYIGNNFNNPGTNPTTLGAYRDHLISAKAPFTIDIEENNEQMSKLNKLRISQSVGEYDSVLTQICKREDNCVDCDPPLVSGADRLRILENYESGYALVREQMPGKWPIPIIKDGKAVLEEWEDVDQQGNRYWYVCRPSQ